MKIYIIACHVLLLFVLVGEVILSKKLAVIYREIQDINFYLRDGICE